MKKKGDSLIFWLVVFTVLVILWGIANVPEKKEKTIPLTEFLKKVKEQNVEKVFIKEKEALLYIKDEKKLVYKTYLPEGYTAKLVDELRKRRVLIEVEKPKSEGWLTFLTTWLPLILIFVFWIIIFRQMQGGNKAFSFGKSKARLFTGTNGKKITFDDVAGVDEAKEELEEIIEFLRNPKKFQKLGGRIPKGVLLVGPPGTGKTLLAKAVAGEADVPFLSISGSDFVELFVGVGASRVRDLFEQAKKLAPCLIFIDEIDAVGRHRGAGLGGGHDEREQTLNQLLVEMDGFDSNEGIIVIAATNRPDILDPALLRPGRFDRRIIVNTPDVKGREEILKVHTREIPLAKDVDLSIIAKTTPGFSGADLANLVNEAALNAARYNKKKVEMEDFEYAKDKILMGKERKSMIISEEEKIMTAYHEAGHALVGVLLKESDPVHKVSIIPRGFALGVTQQLPTDDRYTLSKEYLMAQLVVLFGGRAAEEISLKKITTGAGNDIKRAAQIARRMVTEWGMSDLGPIAYETKDELVFLGKELATKKEYSEETAKLIDKEVKKIVEDAYNQAKNLIKEYSDVLEEMAKTLLEKEVLTSEEIKNIFVKLRGKEIVAKLNFPKEEQPAKKPKKTSRKRRKKEQPKKSDFSEKLKKVLKKKNGDSIKNS